MCGIAGFYDSDLNTDSREKILSDMLEAISHRGPDARGAWYNDAVALGQNRLSIIDLSEEANQPMIRDELVITYNGEIYNYLEIKDKLLKKGYHFHTTSDTEVILASYMEWGTDCVKEFMGMWAFALWDTRNSALFCSRDRFGIKPFYYLHNGNKFYFGSEYKALKKSNQFSKNLNYGQVARGLQLGWLVYEDETWFESLKNLPAASNLIFKNGKVSITKYWTLDTVSSNNFSLEEKSQTFHDLFIQSISQHMRADVEVGGCLSGGLDSSAIASVIGKKYPNSKFKTFTIYYPGKDEVDERPFVTEVLNKYPSLDPHYFTPSDDDIREGFDKMITAADVPVSTSSALSQYFVMQLAASNKIKVLLDGQGSDEFLAGYMHSFYRLIGGLIGKGKLGAATVAWNYHRHQQHFGSGKSLDILMKSFLTSFYSEDKLYKLEFQRYLPFLQNNQNVPFSLQPYPGSRLNNFLAQLLFTTSLPTLLHYEDRNSMAFSIESRVPFLDHRLVEYAFSLQDEDKIYKGQTKYILRKSLSHLLPEKIANRTDKKGFVTPGEVKWLRGCLSFLVEADFSKLDFLNQKIIGEVISEFKKGDNKNAILVWRICVLNYWINRN